MTDNDMEFCNDLFDNMCVASGIISHMSVKFTPQQNCVAERMNRNLLEKVRALMFTSGLPNRALDCKSFIELWSSNQSP